MAGPYFSINFVFKEEITRNGIYNFIKTLEKHKWEYTGWFLQKKPKYSYTGPSERKYKATEKDIKGISNLLVERKILQVSFHHVWPDGRGPDFNLDVNDMQVRKLNKANDTGLDFIALWTDDNGREHILEDSKTVVENKKIIVELMRDLYFAMKPLYAYCDAEEIAGYSNKIDFEKLNIFNENQIYPGHSKAVYNLVNIFSPEFVEKYGKKRLMAPKELTFEELKDGGLLSMDLIFKAKKGRKGVFDENE